MSGIIAVAVLSLVTPLLAPVVVASTQNAESQKSAGFEPEESAKALIEYRQALAAGKLTKPGLIIESAGQPHR